jgi:nucleotide-binding universal stress UspA family protein
MRILVALDRSEYSEIVLEHALDQAVRRGATELHVVTAVADAEEIGAARSWTTALVVEALDSFDCTIPFNVHVRCGIPAVAIAASAIELNPALVVVGRFHPRSVSDEVLELVDYPTLVVGIDGHLLEPQCPACGEVRIATKGEQLFCERHSSDVLPSLASRLPSSTHVGSRLW